MAKVISNRGYNVHLCQYVIIKLQLGEFFREALPNLNVEDLEKMSMLSAFKTVEHPKKHNKSFVCIDENHRQLREFLWEVKNSKCKKTFNRLDYSRRNINLLLRWMFMFIWFVISVFWLSIVFWLICRFSDASYLLHPCPCRLSWIDLQTSARHSERVLYNLARIAKLHATATTPTMRRLATLVGVEYTI